jgi:hypothetical protein
MTICISGVDYDVAEIPVDAVDKEPVAQHLRSLGKTLELPRIEGLREILRDGWGLVTEIGPTGRPTVFTDSRKELILVYHPVDAEDTDTITTQLSADEVRNYSPQMLRALYEATGADIRKNVNIARLGKSIGLTNLTSIEQILSYLAAKQLITKEHYSVRITPVGIEKIEMALEHPDVAVPPYLPAINLINAHTINMAAGAQLMQGAGTMEQASQNAISIFELREALARIEEIACTLETANRNQLESLLKAVRVETERSEPNRGRIRALLSSLKTIAETFVGGAAANLATSAGDPSNAPAIVELVQYLLSHLH